jgi:hypothetical protein
MKCKTPLLDAIIRGDRTPVDMDALYQEIPRLTRSLAYEELICLIGSLQEMNYKGCDLLPVVFAHANVHWYIRNVLRTQDGASWKQLTALIRHGGVLQHGAGELLVDRIRTECQTNIPSQAIECLVILLEKVPSESRVFFDLVPDALHWRTITSAKLAILESYHPLERETVLCDMIRMYSECVELRPFTHISLVHVFRRPWVDIGRWMNMQNGKYRAFITNLVQNDENKAK